MDTTDKVLDSFMQIVGSNTVKTMKYILFLQISAIVNRPLTFCITAGMFMQ